jgi:hypothetical protein
MSQKLKNISIVQPPPKMSKECRYLANLEVLIEVLNDFQHVV